MNKLLLDKAIAAEADYKAAEAAAAEAYDTAINAAEAEYHESKEVE